MDPMIESIIVTVPPDPAFLHVLRQVTFGVGSRLRLTIDDIDDLRLAVDEAATFLLTRLRPSAALSLTLGQDPSALKATIAISADGSTWPPPGLTDTLAWKVIGGLVDRAHAELDETGRPAIVVYKHALDAP
jgi:serine/threonine-protein kinase RsbW